MGTPARYPVITVLLATALASSAARAGTLVEMQTSIGNLYLEINPAFAPATVAAFLDYVEAGRYNNTIIHAAIPGTFIRGGGYKLNTCSEGPEAIAQDPPIPLEINGLLDNNATIAMRRDADDPAGVASEWYISMGDNPNDGSSSGDYTVIGEVIGNGMSLVHEISNAPGVFLSFIHGTPTLNYNDFDEGVDCQTFNRDNVYQVRMEIFAEDDSIPSANYHSGNETLNVTLDLGALGYRSIDFLVTNDGSTVSMRALLETELLLQQPQPNMGAYNPISGELTLPTVAIDGEILFTNARFILSDIANLVFTLTGTD